MHVWYPPPMYAMLCTESVKTLDKGREGEAAGGVGYWQRPNTMALHSRKTANSYNASHLANEFYIRVKDAPMLTKNNVLKHEGVGVQLHALLALPIDSGL